jgi:urate oxidase
MASRLGDNRYGKDGIRLATVRREGDRHHFTDLTLHVRLEGEFTAAHVDGDNAAVLPTDTMRSTCYALAREHGVEGPEPFALLVAGRLLEACPAARSVTVTIESHPWERLDVAGAPHPHAFRAAAGGVRTATVERARAEPPVVTAGVGGLRVLKTTGSAFEGFLEDRYTVLAGTGDRILATTVEATWRYDHAATVDYDRLARQVPSTFAAAFATHEDSSSVQHTMFVMGEAVLDAHPEVAWIRFRLPNEHHVLADLSPFGLDNPGAVFSVTDRPFGVIEGTVVRDRPGAGTSP